MSEQGNDPGAPATLRINTRYRSVDELAAQFAVMVDLESIFVAPRKPLPEGARRRFLVLLADGTVAFGGLAEVMPGRAVLGGRVGARLRFLELGLDAQRVHAAMIAANRRRRRAATGSRPPPPPPPLPPRRRS